MKMRNIEIYAFFSGCGMLDLGFELAGFDIVFVNEIYKPFLEAYKYSRKQMKIDVPKFGYSNEDIENYLNNLEFSRLVQHERENNNLVGFIGGPPCPDFSTAGKNKGEDGKNGRLTKVYFDLIINEKPDFFLFENVKGLLRTKKHRLFYEKMKDRIIASCYYIKEDLRNSLEYGVPQDRERVVMIGIKINTGQDEEKIAKVMEGFDWGIQKDVDEIKELDWPDVSEFGENSQVPMPNGILEECTVQHWFIKNDVENHVNANDFFVPRQGLTKMQTISEGDVSRKSYKRLHRWRYSPTAAYGNNEVHLHPYKCRRLSVSEVLAIQSAPKEFVLPQKMTLTDKFKTVGNGVPVLMAEKIALSVRQALYRIEDEKGKMQIGYSKESDSY